MLVGEVRGLGLGLGLEGSVLVNITVKCDKLLLHSLSNQVGIGSNHDCLFGISGSNTNRPPIKNKDGRHATTHDQQMLRWNTSRLC